MGNPLATSRRRPKLTLSHAPLHAVVLAVSLIAAGCQNPGTGSSQSGNDIDPSPDLEVVRLASAADRATSPGPTLLIGDRIVSTGARNEWGEAYLRLNGPLAKKESSLKWTGLQWQSSTAEEARPELAALGGTLPWGVNAYRVVFLESDTRSVPSVRNAGPGSARERQPRALVPLDLKPDGSFRIPPSTELVYLEWRAPLAAEAGRWLGNLQVTSRDTKPATVRLEITVQDLALTDAPALTVYGELAWDALIKFWPEQFTRVDPRLLSRTDPAHAPAINHLDQMVLLARANRVDIGFGRLQPTVKNTPREGLRFDWTEYDSLVLPWLRGELPSMTSGAVVALPIADLFRTGGVSPSDYWPNVASHFDQQRVLSQTAAPPGLDTALLGPVGRERVRQRGGLPSTSSLEGSRQSTWSAAGQVPEGSSTGLPTVVQISAADGVGPASPAPWFFPGEMFNARGVVPGIGLKWARRAQQDWELIDLARRRGATRVALTVAQRMTQVGIHLPSVGGDLLTPILSRPDWDEGIRIVRDAAAARDPARPSPQPPVEGGDSARDLAEEEALRRWSARVDRSLAWTTSATASPSTEGGHVPFRIEIEHTEPGAETSLTSLPEAWSNLTSLPHDTGITVSGTIDPARVRYPVTLNIDPLGRTLPPNGTLAIESVSGPDRLRSQRESILPSALVLRATDAPELDGSLSDWTDAEIIADGGLVRMLDRVSVQNASTPRSPKPTRVLMRWEKDTLFLALRVDAVSPPASNATRTGVTNFVRETDGRAYGEDLVRLVMKIGDREVRLLVKPSGVTIEAAPPQPGAANTAADTTTVKYAGAVEAGVWRAELRIPASMLVKGELTADTTLEFNLIRHDPETGESASWAGPLDRDYQPLRGVILLVDRITTPEKRGGRIR